MTSPFSSLKKHRHYPMRTGVPNLLKSPSVSNTLNVDVDPDLNTSDDDLNDMIDEITTNMANDNLNKHTSCSQFNTPRSTASTKLSANDNYELMSLMMAKIGRLERRIKQQEYEIETKNNQEKILRDKIRLLQRSNESNKDQPSRVRELEAKCLLLQQQIYEMETFLADYGLVWVGDSQNDELDSEGHDSSTFLLSEGDGLWNPSDSYSENSFKVDYDAVNANINDLNAIAGTQEPKIHSDKQNKRAVLKRPDSVPLILYKNGIILFSGPFRSFDEPSTRQFVKDIMDGYFPSELEDKYPDGVPFEVIDRREVYFKRDNANKVFRGEGRRLGGSRNQSVLVQKSEPLEQLEEDETECVDNSEEEKIVCTELPGPKLSVEQFLSKLPESVIKEGKIIDVRSAIKTFINSSSDNSTMRSNPGDTKTILLQTDSLVDMQERIESGRRSSKSVESNETKTFKSSDERITTLRIKSEDGMVTYVVKMKFWETIGDLQNYLDRARPTLTGTYQIVSSFPRNVLSNKNDSMVDCNLIPNANIRLEKLPNDS